MTSRLPIFAYLKVVPFLKVYNFHGENVGQKLFFSACYSRGCVKPNLQFRGLSFLTHFQWHSTLWWCLTATFRLSIKLYPLHLVCWSEYAVDQSMYSIDRRSSVLEWMVTKKWDKKCMCFIWLLIRSNNTYYVYLISRIHTVPYIYPLLPT